MTINQSVQPSNIKVDDHFWNTFGHSETEVSARWLILFMRARNSVGEDLGWQPFPLKDLVSFYQLLRKQPQESFLFNRLSNAYVIQKNGMVEVTNQFVSNILSNKKLVSDQPLELEDKYKDAYLAVVK